MSTFEIHCKVTGRVQMVMFRDFVKRGASGLGLFGTVRNLSDGSVEVIAQGEKEKLEKLIEKLRGGSIFARVDNVHVKWKEAETHFNNFTILI